MITNAYDCVTSVLIIVERYARQFSLYYRGNASAQSEFLPFAVLSTLSFVFILLSLSLHLSLFATSGHTRVSRSPSNDRESEDD